MLGGEIEEDLCWERVFEMGGGEILAFLFGDNFSLQTEFMLGVSVLIGAVFF